MAAPDTPGLERVNRKEINSQPEGKRGSKVPIHNGPAVGRTRKSTGYPKRKSTD